MNKLNIRKYHILNKETFEVTSSLAFECILYSFLNIQNISQFPVDYIIKWYRIVLIIKLKENRCWIMCHNPGTWHNCSQVKLTSEESCQRTNCKTKYKLGSQNLLLLKPGPRPWARTLNNLDPEKPGTRKTWTLKNMDSERPGL